MKKIALFVYRQSLHYIALCMALLVFLWAYLAYREGRSLRWRLGNGFVFLGIMAVIFYITVYTRGGSPGDAILTPFQSFQAAKQQPEIYRSMLMNVFLFVPLGLSLPFVLGWRKGSGLFTVALAMAFSAGIECLQYRYALGWCEVDDVIMNTLGAAVGCMAYWLFCHWEQYIIPAWKSLKNAIRLAKDKLRKNK